MLICINAYPFSSDFPVLIAGETGESRHFRLYVDMPDYYGLGNIRFVLKIIELLCHKMIVLLVWYIFCNIFATLV
jgi:hypothetical protein